MTIGIIGSGNVANALAIAFAKNNVVVSAIIARNEITGNKLAQKAKASFYKFPINKLPKADVFLICVSDNALQTVIESLPRSSMLIAHTAGSVGLNLLAGKYKNAGVFYPLQTLKFANKNFKKIPICIEASNQVSENKLLKLASSISNKNIKLNSQQRLHLHLAAVITNNFTNHLYAQAHAYLEAHELPFQLLHPLIEKTAEMVFNTPPNKLQTGPAVRYDANTIKKQIALLDDNEALKKLYQLFTASIQKMNPKKQS
ncbi:MAG TPA: DUF2520 domain-containing protein [Bacteroidia bacterium]|nr:DUF2520 domain-containing protein [Bacteroidia bacterium]